MNKKRLGKFLAVSSVFVMSSVMGVVLAGCDGCNKHEHNLTEVAAVNPTCTSEGRSAYYVCDGCDLIFADAEGKTQITEEDIVLAKLAHELEHHDADTATCTHNGNIEYWECVNCDGLFSDEEGKVAVETVITTKNHTWGDEGHHQQVDPTTETEGRLEYWECSECGQYYADEFGDRQVTLNELVIDKVSENIDGVLTEDFYPTQNALIIGSAGVKDGGMGVVINTKRADDGVYLHIVANYNVEATQQPADKGKIGLYFNVRNSDNLYLPGGAGVCLDQAMLMELYLTGSVAYHQPYFLFKFNTKTNEEGANTKYTSTWELFIPHSGFATVNDGAFSEAFETVEGKTALKSGYTYMLTAIGAFAPEETFEENYGSSYCELMDGNSWAFWVSSGHGDWGSDQKYFVLGAQGITTDFQRATDTYAVNVNGYANAEVTGLNDTVDYGDKLEGTVTVEDGYRLSGIKVNGEVFLFSKTDGANTYDYAIEIAKLKNLKWNDTELTVEVVITKLDYQTVEVTLQGVAGGKTEYIAQGTYVTLITEFGDEYTAEVGADGKARFADVLCQQYTVKIDDYIDGLLTVVNGEQNAQVTLNYHFAHNVGTRPDIVDLTDMNEENASITLGAESVNGVDKEVVAVQINLSEEMKNAEAYVLYTTVTVNGDVKEGTNTWLQRFGIRFAEGNGNSYNNKFVIWWDDLGLGFNPSAIWANEATTLGGGTEREPSYSWLQGSVLDGLQLKVVRNGKYVTVSALNLDNNKWYTILSGTTSATAKNDITFFVSGESFTFSDISFEKLQVVDRVAPQGDTEGTLEHLEASNGDIFYLDGEIATAAGLVLQTASVNVSVSAFEKDGKTEVTLADGTEILFVGKLDSYTYTVGETLTKMLVDEYEAYLYGYGKVNFTVSAAGGDINIKLTQVIAYVENGTHGGSSGITVDDTTNTITITGNGLVDDNATWAGSAEIVIPEELKNSTNVALTFTLKDTYSPEGAWDWAARRFGITMQGTNGGIMGFTPTASEASLYVMGANPGEENGKVAFNTLAALIRSADGIKMQVVRLGNRVVVNAEVEDVWVRVGEFACDGEDATKIVIYGEGDTFVFEGISTAKLTYVGAQEATHEADGCIEHYTDGDNYYLANGALTTKEAVTIPQIVEKAVEITVEVYGTDGNKITDADLSNVTVTLTGEYEYNKDVYTALEISGGKLAFESGKMYEGAYTVTVSGYAVDGFVIGEDTSAITLKLYKISSYQVVDVVKTGDVDVKLSTDGATVSLTGKGFDDDHYGESWVSVAELGLPDAVVNSKNVILSFNIKLTNEKGGAYDWAARRFGVTMQGTNGGFMCFTGFPTEASLYVMGDRPSAEADKIACNELAALVRSDSGAQFRLVRNGGSIAIYLLLDNEMVKLGAYPCSADGETKVVFYGIGDTWVFSDIAVYSAPAAFVTPDGSVKVSEDIVYHAYVAPTVGTDGCNAYYSVGENLYTEKGEKTTLEDLKIEQLKAIEITITIKGHKDGAEALLTGTVSATGDYETAFNGTLTDGTVTVDAYQVTYTVSVDGYISKEFTVVEGKTEYELVLEYAYATATYAPEKVDLSNMNNENHEIKFNAHNATDWADWAIPVPEATLTLSDEISASKNVTVEFNLKAANGGFWASNCFGLQMVNGYNGFMFYFSGFDTNDANIYQLHGQKLREDDDKLGEHLGKYAWVEELALSANGVNLRAVRAGTSLTLYAQNAENEWVSLGTVTCDEDAETEIKFMAGAADFTVSDITVEETVTE